MARQPATRLQVNAYRFLVRRMEHALLRGDASMQHDPIRAQSSAFIAGCVLAVIALAVCAILAYLRPNAALGNAPIVMTRESGALYVRVDDILHPVLNLASARLITGSAAKPHAVGASVIARARRGPLLGIAGAPTDIGEPLSRSESAWTVCDSTTSTVIAGEPSHIDRDGRQPSMLVTPRGESAATTYLLYDGWRASVDLRNPAVVWALRLDGAHPRPVSRSLLDAIPEAPPIVPPHIPDAGSRGAVPGMHVGSVVQMTAPDATDYFVVLADGVQRIGEVAANLIRVTDSLGSNAIPTVAPDIIGRLRVVEHLPLSSYPRRAGRSMDASDTGVFCAQWIPERSETILRSDDSLPTDSLATELAQADGDGPHVDNVVMPSGRSAFVKAAALDGDGDRDDSGPRYLVSDGGVLFGIRDANTAKVLGVDIEPVDAPWPILATLPRGPELSRENALVAHDSVAPSP
jgi:type VII secretion protein EccB